MTYTLKASEQQTFILRALVYGLKDEVTVLPKHLRKTETKQKVFYSLNQKEPYISGTGVVNTFTT